MPRKVKPRLPQPPVFDDYPDPADLNLGFQQEEEEPDPEPPRPSRKKSRNVPTNTRPVRVESSSPEPFVEDSITQSDHHLSPVRQSLLSQISFPSHSKTQPVDIRDDLVPTEKVSDQHTPPSDGGIPDRAYSKSPNVDSAAVSSAANTPPVEPGFSTRASFKTRSPPISPPQRYSRPLSFGSTIPPLPAYARQPPGQYGSPPAPHLPQPHFYAAQDIDLGVPQPRRAIVDDLPTFSKLVQISTASLPQRHGIVAGYEGRLRICSYDGGTIEEAGGLSSLPGTVIDAELLHWSSGTDPFSAMRPLVAVNTLQTDEGSDQHKFCVSVYSLGQQKLVADLLQVTVDPVQPKLPGFMPTGSEFCNHLHLKNAGTYLTVSSGKSGEVFVFSPLLTEEGPVFECLNKFWTSIQPREQKRDTSHNRVAPVELIPAGTRKVKPDEEVPMMAISGRWLAVCPPSSSSQHAIGAVLGNDVIASKQAGLEASSAGSRPSVNCDVDSPDADTLLGKVARGVAQEMVKGAKWLGDQGLQAWQSYWKKEDATNPMMQTPPYPNGNYQSAAYGQFPPTHADARQTAKEPEIISVFDLKPLQDTTLRRSGPPVPLATFLPPHGCSFLSFAPNGLMLLTASRKGDYQYVWDLLEMKHNRASCTDFEADGARNAPRVRQLARYDRMSGSIIVDVVWEKPALARFALLTKNKTVHLFDLPPSAMRWPSARKPKKARPTSAPPTGPPTTEHGAAPLGGFFASAMSIAGKTQPMLANFRGRAPSTSGGLAGIGTAGFGIATATGARGSKAVASGLSKSLGAATETVSRLQHAGESRLHLKSEKEAFPNRMFWMTRGSKAGLCILTDSGIKFYQIRRSKARDQRQRETTVFDARRAVTVKFPSPTDTAYDGDGAREFWTSRQNHPKTTGTIHPLSFAEIETNAPYQPFHSDRRVALFIIDQNMQDTQIVARPQKKTSKPEDVWVFGDDVPTIRVNTHPPQSLDQQDEAGSVIYRETAMDGEQVVSTTRRRKKKTSASQYDGRAAEEEGFFEDDFEVLDFASDRV